MVPRPTGTVTFLFTDIEGSTRLWEADPDAMRPALQLHDELLRAAIAAHGGYVFSTGGDSFAAAFSRRSVRPSPPRSTPRQALGRAAWPGTARAARADGHPHRRGDRTGRRLLRPDREPRRPASWPPVTAGRSCCRLPPRSCVRHRAALHDLREHRLKDLSEPEHLWQLGDDGRSHRCGPWTAHPHNLPDPADAAGGQAGRHRGGRRPTCGPIASSRWWASAGAGKTRLAQATAAVMIEHVPRRRLVRRSRPGRARHATSPRRSPRPPASTSAAATRVDGLVDVMARRRALFVLDNCEHLTDGVADLVDTILDRTTEPRLLVTSREPLDLDDEQRQPVDPLDASDCDLTGGRAVRQRRRAGRVRRSTPPRSPSSPRSAGTSTACPSPSSWRRGNSATWLPRRSCGGSTSASPSSPAAGAGAPGGRRASTASCRTPGRCCRRASRTCSKHLAAFPAAFDLESAEEIFGPATAGELAGLVDRCLVVAEGGPGTYRLLETVKLFARRQWQEGADPDVYLDRHADALLAHIERWSDDERYSLNSVMGWHARHLHDLRAADDHLHDRGDPVAAAKLWSAGSHPLAPRPAGQRPPAPSNGWTGRLQSGMELGPAAGRVARRAGGGLRRDGHSRPGRACTASARRAIEAATGAAGCEVVRAFALNVMSWMTMINDLPERSTCSTRASSIATAAGAPTRRGGGDDLPWLRARTPPGRRCTRRDRTGRPRQRAGPPPMCRSCSARHPADGRAVRSARTNGIGHRRSHRGTRARGHAARVSDPELGRVHDRGHR